VGVGKKMKNRDLTVSLMVSLSLALLLLLAWATPSLSSSHQEQKKVVKPFSTMGGDDVHTIPRRSIVKYLPDGTTEVIGPDGGLLLSVRGDEVATITTHLGPKKATHLFQHPSGSFVHSASENVVEVYDPDNELILTIVDESGEKVSAGGSRAPPAFSGLTVPDFDGWVECAYDWFGNSVDISYFYAEWYVPTRPRNNWMDDDVVFLFPGVTGDGRGAWSGRGVIVQPVLEFNQGGWLPGNPHDIASWVADDQGNGHRSSPVGVSTGDSLAGKMIWDYQNNRWIIYSWNRSSGKGTCLVTDLMSGGDEVVTALEGYNLETTSDLYGTVSFSNMEFSKRDYVHGGNDRITVSWDRWFHPYAKDYFSGLDVTWTGSSHTTLHTGR